MSKQIVRQTTIAPILICDGLHGINAPQNAVRTLENMRDNGALDLHIPPLSEFALAAITEGPLDPIHDCAWDTIQSQLEVTINGVEYFIYDRLRPRPYPYLWCGLSTPFDATNRDIWLIPCDWRWSEAADFFVAPSTA